MVNLCMCGAGKAAGLTVLAFSIGMVIGMFCPLAVLVVIELLMLLFLGYLCLFKW